jgi:co-chaperonin GroES (HSP10)
MSDTFDISQVEHVSTMDKDGWFNDSQIPLPKKVLQPWGYRILVMPVRPPAKTKGGIIVPIVVQETQGYLNYIGRLVAVGTGAFKHQRYAQMGMKPADHPKIGDWVFYPVYQYNRLRMVTPKGEIRFVMMNDDQILGTAPKGVNPWQWKVER